VARLLLWDVLRLSGLSEEFDTVLDSGLFHNIEQANRTEFRVRPGIHGARRFQSIPAGGRANLRSAPRYDQRISVDFATCCSGTRLSPASSTGRASKHLMEYLSQVQRPWCHQQRARIS
jgi:hypothetical protein